MKETVVIAIGGNAIHKESQKGTMQEQMQNINETVDIVVDLIELGYKVVITHGNGPQVGASLIQKEAAKEMVVAHPLDFCVAETQGSIGYMILLCLNNCLRARGITHDVAAVLTQVEVDKNDPAFNKPTKPIGPFYSKEESEELECNKGYKMVEDSGRGYRRVVASPKPIKILESAMVKKLSENATVIAVGGGGIPCCLENNEYRGLEAVIDKDYASALLASEIKADYYVMLTGVSKVAINFGKANQEDLSVITTEEAKKHYADGQFPPGSMGPKVDAAIGYLENGGKNVIITSIDSLKDALAGTAGTTIVS